MDRNIFQCAARGCDGCSVCEKQLKEESMSETYEDILRGCKVLRIGPFEWYERSYIIKQENGIKSLEAENDEMREKLEEANEKYSSMVDTGMTNVEKLNEKLALAAEVLGFYANPVVNEKEWLEDYSSFTPYPPTRGCCNSHGKRARAALKQIKGEV